MTAYKALPYTRRPIKNYKQCSVFFGIIPKRRFIDGFDKSTHITKSPFREICNVLFHHYSAFYCARNDEIVHYKSDETVFAVFDVQLYVAYNRFYELCFFYIYKNFISPRNGSKHKTNPLCRN